MKKETMVLFAGMAGVVAVLGFFALKRFLSDKNYEIFEDDYYSHNFSDWEDDDQHGIEYLAMN